MRDVPNSSADEAIISIVISRSELLGRDAITDGDEAEVERVLTFKGCSLFQGDLFSEPVPHPEFDQLLVRQAVSLAPKSDISC